PFIVYAPVQTDKTKESVIEIEKELKGILDGHPPTDEELNKVKKMQTLELAGTWETMDAVNSSIREIVRYGLPDDYFKTYSSKVRDLTLEQVTGAAKKLLNPDKVVWIVVGDRTKIEPGIREWSGGEIHLIDTDGKPVQ